MTLRTVILMACVCVPGTVAQLSAADNALAATHNGKIHMGEMQTGIVNDGLATGSNGTKTDNLTAQSVVIVRADPQEQLTGNLFADLAGVPVQDTAVRQPLVMLTAQKKSSFIAGFASLVLPGAGEAYVGEYTKGVIFIVAEVVGITAGILYNNKGDRRTNEFQDYADNHWSAVKYAEYLNTYAGQYRSNKDNAHIPIDLTTSGLKPWQRVDFNVINAYESEGFAWGFSHKLPKYGEQQYYELIGKYNQFKYGWDTYPVEANDMPANDNGDYNSPPQQLLDYAANRGSANDFYSASRLAISIVVVNHLLSAVDAYLSAHHYNTEISSHMSMDVQRYGDRIVAVPQLSVSVGL